jgi:hypothetical protein
MRQAGKLLNLSEAAAGSAGAASSRSMPEADGS